MSVTKRHLRNHCHHPWWGKEPSHYVQLDLYRLLSCRRCCVPAKPACGCHRDTRTHTHVHTQSFPVPRSLLGMFCSTLFHTGGLSCCHQGDFSGLVFEVPDFCNPNSSEKSREWIPFKWQQEKLNVFCSPRHSSKPPMWEKMLKDEKAFENYHG